MGLVGLLRHLWGCVTPSCHCSVGSSPDSGSSPVETHPLRWVLVRHGAHADGCVGAHGREQVEELRNALELRQVRPSLCLVSERAQACAMYALLVQGGSLWAPCTTCPELTPGAAS